MSDRRVADVLRRVAEGTLAPPDALAALDGLLVEDLGYANVDHARPLVQGFPEVVFGAGKTVEQVLGISRSLEAANGSFLITRLPDAAAQPLIDAFPEVEIDALARTAWLRAADEPTAGDGTALIVSAGTSDEPVAREAAVTVTAGGCRVERLVDAGVAGIHRLLRQTELLRRAQVVIVVAGMDGALPSVVGGMVPAPVIAVPTSVGYGAAFSGVSALLAMLNSCASGVTVVNIDGGFTAGMAAIRILRSRTR